MEVTPGPSDVDIAVVIPGLEVPGPRGFLYDEASARELRPKFEEALVASKFQYDGRTKSWKHPTTKHPIKIICYRQRPAGTGWIIQ